MAKVRLPPHWHANVRGETDNSSTASRIRPTVVAFHMQGKRRSLPSCPAHKSPPPMRGRRIRLPGKRSVSLCQIPARTGENGRRRGWRRQETRLATWRKAGPRKNHQLSHTSQVYPPRAALSLPLPNAPLHTNTCAFGRGEVHLGQWVMGEEGYVRLGPCMRWRGPWVGGWRGRVGGEEGWVGGWVN